MRSSFGKRQEKKTEITTETKEETGEPKPEPEDSPTRENRLLIWLQDWRNLVIFALSIVIVAFLAALYWEKIANGLYRARSYTVGLFKRGSSASNRCLWISYKPKDPNNPDLGWRILPPDLNDALSGAVASSTNIGIVIGDNIKVAEKEWAGGGEKPDVATIVSSMKLTGARYAMIASLFFRNGQVTESLLSSLRSNDVSVVRSDFRSGAGLTRYTLTIAVWMLSGETIERRKTTCIIDAVALSTVAVAKSSFIRGSGKREETEWKLYSGFLSGREAFKAAAVDLIKEAFSGLTREEL